MKREKEGKGGGGEEKERRDGRSRIVRKIFT